MAYVGANVGAQTIWKRRRQIKNREMPTVLFYGDSQLTRFKNWIKNPNQVEGPTFLDRYVLQHKHFCAVGGSKFSTIHDRVQGINVPPTQPFRGNLWRYTNVVKELRPDYIVVSLGFNDISGFDRLYKREMADFRRINLGADEIDENHRFADPEFWANEQKKILDSADEVIGRLRLHFPDSRLIFVGVIPDKNWCYESVSMCNNLEWHMKEKLGMKLAPIAGLVEKDVHIDRDGVHLNPSGFRLFMDKVVSRMIDMWLGPLYHHNVAPN